MLKRLTALLLIVLSAAPLWAAPEITVAAAADLNAALSEIAANYQKQTGRMVKLAFGSSGNLTTQIENGAPFDVFLSADTGYPKKLIDDGFADPNSLFTYAVGRLVLWMSATSSLDAQHQGMQVLLDPSVKKIAIANPEHAPYGRAAVAALKHYKLYNKVTDRLVLGENVAQAAQFVESGNAQIGLVALSHALAPAMNERGKYWEVPADAYPPLDQGAVILSHSHAQTEAAEFLDYLKSSAATEILRRYGFSLPERKP